MKRLFFSIILFSFCLTGIGVLAQDSQVSLSSKGVLFFGKNILMGIYNIIIKSPWNAIKWIFDKIWQFIKYIGNMVKSIFVKNHQSEIKEEFIKETKEIKDFFPNIGEDIIKKTKEVVK